MSQTSQINFNAAKRLVARHFPHGAPTEFLFDLYKAIRDAETRGFSECLSYFNRPEAANDDTPRSESSA